MESIIRDVSALDDAQRHTLEHVIGRELRENQRLVINVCEIDLSQTAEKQAERRPQTLEDWAKLYEGLTEQQIEGIDRIAKTRANLTRHLP